MDARKIRVSARSARSAIDTFDTIGTPAKCQKCHIPLGYGTGTGTPPRDARAGPNEKDLTARFWGSTTAIGRVQYISENGIV
jgi:hypothetical protein